MALKVIQVKLNHFEAAQNLLYQMLREEKVGVVIVADQCRNLDGLSLKSDAASSVAIWACSKHSIQEVMKNPKEAFVRVKISSTHFDFERI